MLIAALKSFLILGGAQEGARFDVREDYMVASQQQNYPIWARTPQAPPPDWRWRRACFLVDRRRNLSCKRDDPLLARTVRYIRALRLSSTEDRLRLLAKKDPDLYLAFQVSQEASNRPLEIKARVLARQSDAGIAWRVGLPVAAVQTFVGLYFDVRDRIDARSYITHCVIGFDPDWRPTPEELMLLTAYLHGPGVIEPWLDFLEHVDEQHDLTTEAGRMRASLQLLLDVHRLPADEATQFSLLRRHRFVDLIGRKIPKLTPVAASVSQTTSRMLHDLPWAKDPAQSMATGASAEGGAAGLRAFRKQQRAQAG
jgi:hypothetical protein